MIKRLTGKGGKVRTARSVAKSAERYFADCRGTLLYDGDGKPVIKNAQPVFIGVTPPTVSGLAGALGFVSREALIRCEGESPAVRRAIRRALLRVEDFLEGRLTEKDARDGALLLLKMQFGWEEEAAKPPAKDEVPRVEIEVVGEG